jgi:hypothetical protein
LWKKAYICKRNPTRWRGISFLALIPRHLYQQAQDNHKKRKKMVRNLENEIWKPVVGFEGKYMVSNMGRVKSLSYQRTGEERLLSQVCMSGNYLGVSLWKNNKGKRFMEHRLVYETFHGYLPKFVVTMKGDERMEVNHINEIKTDNRLENLELITCTQNNNHGTHKQRIAKSNSKKVYQYTMDGNFVKEWDSTKSCAEYGFNQSAVSACCRNTYCHRERNDYKKYIWSFNPPKQCL